MEKLSEYSDLSPDAVLDAVESVGMEVTGTQIALNSFENRVVQVGTYNHGFVVAKFYRAHRWSDAAIKEEHAFAYHLMEHEIPIVGPLRIDNQTLFYHGGFRFALFPRRGGREPNLESEDNLEWFGRMLGRMHAAAHAFRFQHRNRLLDPERVERAAWLVRERNFIPPHLDHDYTALCKDLLERIRTSFESRPVTHPVHGDCHRGNVLWTDDGPHMVDLDDTVTGPAVADLWMLMDGDPDTRARQLEVLLKGYEQFFEFDHGQLALIPALQAARVVEYAAWIAERWPEPTFVEAFQWFEQPRFWEQHLGDLREQLHRLGG